MAEIPRLRQISGSGSGSGKKISVSEHVTNGVDSIPDSFIVDLGSFSNGGGLYHHISADSRIILPRSFSRKGYQRAAGDSTSLLLAATCSSPPSPSSPGGQTGPSSMQEKPTATSHPPAVVIAVEPTDDSDDLKPQPNSHPHHHQITMKTSSIAPAASSSSPESQLGRRRSPLPWYSHPKRVLLFFATISSIGTLLLICFTLAINKPYSSSD